MCEAADLRLTLTAQAASTPGTDDFYGFSLWQWTDYSALAPNVHYSVWPDQTPLILDKD